jgi:NAD(P)H-hydrate repair Nnr-like enzyme with NAD(P)H-hydrate epimerase domain
MDEKINFPPEVVEALAEQYRDEHMDWCTGCGKGDAGFESDALDALRAIHDAGYEVIKRG